MQAASSLTPFHGGKKAREADLARAVLPGSL
jgi:hypothetical protein